MRYIVLIALVVGCGRLDFAAVPDAASGGTGDGQSGDGNGDAAMQGGVAGTTVSAWTFGGAGNEEAYDIAVASDGSFAITGTTDGTVTIGSVTLVSAGGEDILLARFAADGTPLWAKRFGLASGDRGQAIGIDAAGNLYIAGLFTGAVDFGGTTCTPAAMADAFVASYQPSGALRWVRCAGTANLDFAYDLAVEADGHVTITGYDSGAIDFGLGALPVAGQREVFVVRYDSNGTVLKSRAFASTGDDSGQGIALTSSGNLVVSGQLGAAYDFGGGTIGAAGSSFVVELDSNLNHVWSTAIPLTTSWDLDVDKTTGRIVLASRTTTGTDLGSGPLSPPGGNDTLVYSIAGDRQSTWYQTFGGDMSDIGLGVAIDGAGNSYTIGLGGPNIDFGMGLVTGNGNQDIFIASHASDGTPRWGHMFGGTSQDRGYGAAIGPDGNLYISGRFAGTANFGTGAITAAGLNDLFVVRLQ